MMISRSASASSVAAGKTRSRFSWRGDTYSSGTPESTHEPISLGSSANSC